MALELIHVISFRLISSDLTGNSFGLIDVQFFSALPNVKSLWVFVKHIKLVKYIFAKRIEIQAASDQLRMQLEICEWVLPKIAY